MPDQLPTLNIGTALVFNGTIYNYPELRAELIALDEEDIADRVFTSRADLPEGVERIALRTVRALHDLGVASVAVFAGVEPRMVELP